MNGITIQNAKAVNLHINNSQNITLKTGEVINARIIKLDGNTAQISIKNILVNARIDESVHLYTGQSIKLFTKNIDSQGLIVFELLNQDRSHKDAVKDLLNRLNIDKSSSNIRAVELLLQHELPISKNNVDIIRSLISKIQIQKIIYNKNNEIPENQSREVYFQRFPSDEIQWVFCIPLIINGYNSKLSIIKFNQAKWHLNHDKNTQKYILFIDTKNLGLIMAELFKHDQHVHLNISVEKKEVAEFMNIYKKLFSDNIKVKISYEQQIMQNIKIPKVDIRI